MSESAATELDPEATHTLRRAARLTSIERALLLLAAHGGLTHRGLAEALGVSKGNIDATLQRIRRKLAVPPKQDLRTFVGERPWLEPALADPEFGARRESDERRRLLLLRATVDDLRAVSVRARQRAEALDQRQMSTEINEARRIEELWMLRRVAEIVDESVDEALRIARRRGAGGDSEFDGRMATIGGRVAESCGVG